MTVPAAERNALIAELAEFASRVRALADAHASVPALRAGLLLKTAAEELEAIEVSP